MFEKLIQFEVVDIYLVDMLIVAIGVALILGKNRAPQPKTCAVFH